MKTLIHFSNKQKPSPECGKKEILALLLLCFKCCRKTGAVRQMISEIYLLLHPLWTGLPPGAITV